MKSKQSKSMLTKTTGGGGGRGEGGGGGGGAQPKLAYRPNLVFIKSIFSAPKKNIYDPSNAGQVDSFHNRFHATRSAKDYVTFARHL